MLSECARGDQSPRGRGLARAGGAEQHDVLPVAKRQPRPVLPRGGHRHVLHAGGPRTIVDELALAAQVAPARRRGGSGRAARSSGVRARGCEAPHRRRGPRSATASRPLPPATHGRADRHEHEHARPPAARDRRSRPLRSPSAGERVQVPDRQAAAPPQQPRATDAAAAQQPAEREVEHDDLWTQHHATLPDDQGRLAGFRAKSGRASRADDGGEQLHPECLALAGQPERGALLAAPVRRAERARTRRSPPTSCRPRSMRRASPRIARSRLTDLLLSSTSTGSNRPSARCPVTRSGRCARRRSPSRSSHSSWPFHPSSSSSAREPTTCRPRAVNHAAVHRTCLAGAPTSSAPAHPGAAARTHPRPRPRSVSRRSATRHRDATGSCPPDPRRSASRRARTPSTQPSPSRSPTPRPAPARPRQATPAQPATHGLDRPPGSPHHLPAPETQPAQPLVPAPSPTLPSLHSSIGLCMELTFFCLRFPFRPVAFSQVLLRLCGPRPRQHPDHADLEPDYPHPPHQSSTWGAGSRAR